MAQVQSEMRRALVALARIDFEAMQDDFLEPWRQVRPQTPRRQRRAGQPLAPLADGARLAERPRPGGEEIQEHAERKQITAPVVANAEQLLRRDIDAGADRACELLAGKIGQIEMAGEAEIEQHHFAVAVADHDIARLEIEMNDALAM